MRSPLGLNDSKPKGVVPDIYAVDGCISKINIYPAVSPLLSHGATRPPMDPNSEHPDEDVEDDMS
jgi:hypothetical protein